MMRSGPDGGGAGGLSEVGGGGYPVDSGGVASQLQW